MDGIEAHEVEWHKPRSKSQILHVFAHMCNVHLPWVLWL
jgi:hypothetical protein